MIKPTFDAVVIQYPLKPYSGRIALAKPNEYLINSMLASGLFLNINPVSPIEVIFSRNPCFIENDFNKAFLELLNQLGLERVNGLNTGLNTEPESPYQNLR